MFCPSSTRGTQSPTDSLQIQVDQSHLLTHMTRVPKVHPLGTLRPTSVQLGLSQKKNEKHKGQTKTHKERSLTGQIFKMHSSRRGTSQPIHRMLVSWRRPTEDHQPHAQSARVFIISRRYQGSASNTKAEMATGDPPPKG